MITKERIQYLAQTYFDVYLDDDEVMRIVVVLNTMNLFAGLYGLLSAIRTLIEEENKV